MYFVPNDTYILSDQLEYDNSIYLNYLEGELNWDINNSVDNIFEIDFQNEADGNLDVFHLSDNFDDFGGIHIHIVTVDNHGNTFINRSSINYEFVYPNETSRVLAPFEDIYIEFNGNAFTNNAKVLIYENQLEDFDISRDNILLSNFVTFESTEQLNSNADISFGLNDIDLDYLINHIGIVKYENNKIINIPSYIDEDRIRAEINSMGAYALIYNEAINNEDNMNIPSTFNIESCYPNPFNPSVSIDYNLDVESNISIKVYNVLGQEVKTIFNGFKSFGRHSAIWNGLNNKGNQMPSGIYFIELDNYKLKVVKPVTLL